MRNRWLTRQSWNRYGINRGEYIQISTTAWSGSCKWHTPVCTNREGKEAEQHRDFSSVTIQKDDNRSHIMSIDKRGRYWDTFGPNQFKHSILRLQDNRVRAFQMSNLVQFLRRNAVSVLELWRGEQFIVCRDSIKMSVGSRNCSWVQWQWFYNAHIQCMATSFLHGWVRPVEGASLFETIKRWLATCCSHFVGSKRRRPPRERNKPGGNGGSIQSN